MMRRWFILFLPAVWLWVSDGTYRDDSGAVVARGVVVERIEWDGRSAYTPPAGVNLQPDDGTPVAATVQSYVPYRP